MKHQVTMTPIVKAYERGPLMVGDMEADGTHYSLVVIPIPVGFSDRFLGSVSGEGYIVINGLNRKAYLFSKQGFNDPLYLGEKIGQDTTQCDLENVIHLMDTMIPTRSSLPYKE